MTLHFGGSIALTLGALTAKLQVQLLSSPYLAPFRKGIEYTHRLRTKINTNAKTLNSLKPLLLFSGNTRSAIHSEKK